MLDSPEQPNYRGLRALMLLRVSTEEQEKKYGFPSQERSIREKLIEPLGLRLNAEKYIIRDTYTGLEFRNRPVLKYILELANRGEFDVLTMDVLDRLGRRGLPREIYRMQLRELGIRILKGKQAEDELQNTLRRTMGGKRAKALGDSEKGIQAKVIGTGRRTYGYSWTYTEKGRRDGLTPNTTIILVEEDGTEWSEVTVVVFIFKSARDGVPIRSIARILNEKGIKGPMGGDWLQSTVSDMLRNRTYIGEYHHFKQRNERVPGKKVPLRTPRPLKEQIIITVPFLIDQCLFEKVQQRLKDNQQFSRRNNQHPEDTLLQGGFAKCAYCHTCLEALNHAS